MITPYLFEDLVTIVKAGHFSRNSHRWIWVKIYQRPPLNEILTDCRSILDIGCGTGAMASALRDSGYQITGVDASLGMLRQANK